MDTTFIYDKPVTGKFFVGKKKDIEVLHNLVFSGESVAIYDEPGTGKDSLIRQVITDARMRGERFITADIDLTKARSTEDIMLSFAREWIKSCANSPAECRQMVEELLPESHLVFDKDRFATDGEVVSTNWILDNGDLQKIFGLPAEIAKRKSTRLVTIVSQFQSVLLAEDSSLILSALEKVVEQVNRQTPFIFTGSHLNAMKEIFDVKRYFWHTVTPLGAGTIDNTEFYYHIHKGFQPRGKVIEKDLVISTIELLRKNPWYVNHLFSIVDSMTRGYIYQTNMDEGLNNLLSIHRPRFYSSVCNLTDFQLRLLKAVVDGETKFSSSSIIDKYRLNSSANVKRLKDALVKKEILWFDNEDIPHVQDVLFEYWLRKEFFA